MCLQIFACLFPPIAVCWKRGCCTPEFFLSILLTIFGWIPGCCYACCVVNQDERSNGNVNVTTINKIEMAAPVAPPPQHIVVNVNERQGSNGGPYNPHYPIPAPYNPGTSAPPPYGTAPPYPYYGEGENFQHK